MDISGLRKDYRAGALEKDALENDPFRQFGKWFADATRCPQVFEANAMILSTVDENGCPASRTVLLKGVEPDGFRFFTNHESRKAAHLRGNPAAALLFYWGPMERQIQIEGRVERLPSAEAEAYFQTRPRGSQLGAWASQQSREIPDRGVLERRLAELEAEYRDRAVPMPPFWGGYLLRPLRFEFWQGRSNRLHDRFRYSRGGDGGWTVCRLAP